MDTGSVCDASTAVSAIKCSTAEEQGHWGTPKFIENNIVNSGDLIQKYLSVSVRYDYYLIIIAW